VKGNPPGVGGRPSTGTLGRPWSGGLGGARCPAHRCVTHTMARRRAPREPRAGRAAQNGV